MMFRSAKWFITIVSSILLINVWWLPAQAASDGFLQFPGADNPDNICSHGFVSIQAVYTPNTDDLDGVDYVGIALVDGNETLLFAYISGAGVGSDTTTLDSVLPLGATNGAINDIAARPVTWRLYDTTLTYNATDGWSQQQIFDALEQEGSVVDTFSFDPAFVVDFCDLLPVPGYDFSRLEVYAVCSPTPNFAIWYIRNYNLYNVRFAYQSSASPERITDLVIGTLILDGQLYSERRIETPAKSLGATTLKLYVNDKLQDVAVHTPHNIC